MPETNTKPALRVVDPVTGELHDTCPQCQEKAHVIRGLDTTIKSQAGIIGRLQRDLEEQDPSVHPRHAEMTALIDRWKRLTGHPRSKVSKDRLEVIKARLKEGYSFEHMELAIDGIAAYPYVVSGSRHRHGQANQKHDAMTIALKSGENVERFANLGYLARKEST